MHLTTLYPWQSGWAGTRIKKCTLFSLSWSSSVNCVMTTTAAAAAAAAAWSALEEAELPSTTRSAQPRPRPNCQAVDDNWPTYNRGDVLKPHVGCPRTGWRASKTVATDGGHWTTSVGATFSLDNDGLCVLSYVLLRPQFSRVCTWAWRERDSAVDKCLSGGHENNQMM